MKTNKYLIITFAASIINLIASLVFVTTLPDIVPTHFNANFEVDSIGSKWTALILAFLPLLVAMSVLLELKFRKKDYPNRKPLQITMLLISVFFICINWIMLCVMQGEAVIGAEMKHMPHFGFLLLIIFGLLFIGMGNYLPTIAQNKTLGIKISWTLNNEQCWKLTHRFGGKVFVAAGFLTILSSIIGMLAGISADLILIVFLIILSATLVIISVFAYHHRND